MDLEKLKLPFKDEEIEWRISRSGFKNGKPWAKVLAYITNRAIMDRLDEVCGPGYWRNEFRQWGEKGILCGIAIYNESQDPDIFGNWVFKWDGAEETQFEKVKGGFSSAMKRAAVQWGMGRYLYSWEESWAMFHAKGGYSAKIEVGKDAKGNVKYDYFKWDPPQRDRPTQIGPEEREEFTEQPDIFKRCFDGINKLFEAGYIDADESKEMADHLDEIAGKEEKLEDYLIKLIQRYKKEKAKAKTAQEMEKEEIPPDDGEVIDEGQLDLDAEE